MESGSNINTAPCEVCPKMDNGNVQWRKIVHKVG